MNQLYCYRHIRSDTDKPFYVGIGTKHKRGYNSLKTEYARAYAVAGRSDIWNKIFKKCNGDISVDILYECDSVDEIKSKEVEFIKLYGRINNNTGMLSNLTDGGEGNHGWVVTDTIRKNISKSLTGRKVSEEDRIKMSIDRKTNPLQIEKVRKMHEGNIGRTHSDDTIKKMRAYRLKKFGNKNLMKDRNASMGTGTGRVLIGKYDLSENLIETFLGYPKAALSVNAAETGVWSAVNGGAKTYKGFIWKRINKNV